jgi:hypothetical protein
MEEHNLATYVIPIPNSLPPVTIQVTDSVIFDIQQGLCLSVQNGNLFTGGLNSGVYPVGALQPLQPAHGATGDVTYCFKVNSPTCPPCTITSLHIIHIGSGFVHEVKEIEKEINEVEIAIEEI